MLSVHQSKTTHHLGRDPSLGPISRHEAAVLLFTAPSAGRALSIVHEAEPSSLPWSPQVEESSTSTTTTCPPPALAPALAPVPAPVVAPVVAPVRGPVLVPLVPPRRSSAAHLRPRGSSAVSSSSSSSSSSAQPNRKLLQSGTTTAVTTAAATTTAVAACASGSNRKPRRPNRHATFPTPSSSSSSPSSFSSRASSSRPALPPSQDPAPSHTHAAATTTVVAPQTHPQTHPHPHPKGIVHVHVSAASPSWSASASPRRRRRPVANASLLGSLLGQPAGAMDTTNMAENQIIRHPPRGPRDSHDLSLSPRDITRDSLVVNMLLSLDQLSSAQSPAGASTVDSRAAMTAFDDSESSRLWSDDTNTRHDGSYGGARSLHARQPSYGSQAAADLRAANKPVKNPVRHRPSRGPLNQSGISASGPDGHDGHAGGAGHGNQTSKSRSRSASASSSASIDLAPSQPHAHGTKRRPSAPKIGASASFSHAPEQSQLEHISLSSPFHVDFPEDLTKSDRYVAAPTPTVPGGPRREPRGLSIFPPPSTSQLAESRSLPQGLGTSRPAKPASSKDRRTTTKQNPAQAAPPASSGGEIDAAPAPSVGYGKSKLSKPPTTDPSLAQQRDRAGFFRRVFGGSTTKAHASSGSLTGPQASSSRLPSSPPSPPSPTQTTTPERQQQRQQKQQSRPVTATAPSSRNTSSSQSHTQPLQKKSSSFFRRRKKSVAEEARPDHLPTTNKESVPPVPSLQSENKATKDNDAAQKHLGSVGSPKHQLMNSNPPVSAAGLGLKGVALSTLPSHTKNTRATSKSESRMEANHSEYKREFSSDYEPASIARIRKVNSDHGGESHQSTPSRPSKTPQKKLRASHSFLDLDAGSDNDESGRVTQENGDSSRSVSKKKDGRNGGVATVRVKNQQLSQVDESTSSSAQSGPGPPTNSNGGGGGGGRAKASASDAKGSEHRTVLPSRPVLRIEEAGGERGPKFTVGLGLDKASEPIDEPQFVIGEPTEDDRQKAQRIFDGGEEFIQKDKAAAWMGEQGPVRQRTLQAYMELYDFTDQSILSSLRQVCERLILRAETQQVDRILVTFSKRWFHCNPRHGFKATDVIHMICYSIMLLNTDLHLADIEQKMTRSQFVKNTMTTITQALAESAPDAFCRPTILPEKGATLQHADAARQPAADAETARSNRFSFRPPPPLRLDTNSSDCDDCGPLVKAPFNGSMRGWEELVEIVLKSIYASIREERLPLFGAEHERPIPAATSQSSLSVLGLLKRTPSVLSKAPSEAQQPARGRLADSGRTSASRWTSKSRSRTGLGRTGLSSSRTSFDDGSSMWSPAMSSATWSKHSLGRTQGSMSQDSFASSMPRGDYQQSIGFANALSQAIIRDEDANGHESAPSLLSTDLSSTQLLDDESLELAGPPWVKEGMAVHKHHLDGYGKRARDRNWTEVFAVVQKGQISLFSFNASKSMRQRSRFRNANAAGRPLGPVGGGNWQDNAVCLGTFNLRLTLASALPSPGYSRTRPHVWALSLPTGAIHLFQVGTPEIIREFVTTANYWSARLSTHPLVGGISNVEYGWSDAIVNRALVSAVNAEPATSSSSSSAAAAGAGAGTGSSAAHGRKSSITSFRGPSFDHVSGAFTHNSGRAKLPGDRIHIADWTPPAQSMRASNASEAEQLEALDSYVKNIEEELQAHNQLRNPMMLAFTPRGPNAGKSMANWERKSAYLLREIVKFRTYVDCLQQAEARKREIYRERDLAQRAAKGELSDGDMGFSEDDEDADETLRP